MPPLLGCELPAGVRGGVQGSGTTFLVLLAGLGYPWLDELQDIQLQMGQLQRETASVAGPAWPLRVLAAPRPGAPGQRDLGSTETPALHFMEASPEAQTGFLLGSQSLSLQWSSTP